MRRDDNDTPLTNVIALVILILLVVLWAVWTESRPVLIGQRHLA